MYKKEIEVWLFSFNEDVLCVIKRQVQVCEAAVRLKHICVAPDVIVKPSSTQPGSEHRTPNTSHRYSWVNISESGMMKSIHARTADLDSVVFQLKEAAHQLADK